MTPASIFSQFIDRITLSAEKISEISTKYRGITAALNIRIYGINSDTQNSLQVGSYGRNTAIHSVSDLDMIYIMPLSLQGKFSGEGSQSRLLKYVKDALTERYPNTNIRVDRQIVSVPFAGFHIEVLPTFPNDDGSFTHADTYCGGKWCRTHPKAEIEALRTMASLAGSGFKHLCKMMRAWKNNTGVPLSGFLIDTLVYNFFKNSPQYYAVTFGDYPKLCLDFFKFLSSQPVQQYYLAPGSNSRVDVPDAFQKKANAAALIAIQAIETDISSQNISIWKKIFGKLFPTWLSASEALTASSQWNDTEQFIEDKFVVDITELLEIDCSVLQKGFRLNWLSEMLKSKIPLLARKTLEFSVKNCTAAKPYDIYWKVLNRGPEARRRNQIRGEIFPDSGFHKQEEHTKFRGEHYVECYAVKDSIVVARDRILVPIQSNYEDEPE